MNAFGASVTYLILPFIYTIYAYIKYIYFVSMFLIMYYMNIFNKLKYMHVYMTVWCLLMWPIVCPILSLFSLNNRYNWRCLLSFPNNDPAHCSTYFYRLVIFNFVGILTTGLGPSQCAGNIVTPITAHRSTASFTHQPERATSEPTNVGLMSKVKFAFSKRLK